MIRKVTYRRIYAAHHGPIGKDKHGRSLEVHHLDGNHENNSIENLKLVTIDEHYAIHKAQGDYVACFLMAKRMKLSPEELSEIARENNRIQNARRLKDGTHNFFDSQRASEWNNQRVQNGTHVLLGGKIQREAMLNGTSGCCIKVSCLRCQKESNVGVFFRIHNKEKCTELHKDCE